MVKEKYILALDEGTTSARAIVWDINAKIKGQSAYEIKQIYPKSGWVEHDPEEIWYSQLKAIREAIRIAQVKPDQIDAIGIANQRETTLLWDKKTGKPVYNAIVWQCRRTNSIVENLQENFQIISEKTGLIPDSYFSGPKIKWLLENIPNLKTRCENNEILFGNIDTFLIWRLTGGKSHVTDYTNASRTMIFNLHKLDWDDELLELLRIPREILPEPRPSSDRSFYGYAEPSLFGAPVKICGDAGDQQAALFGQSCFSEGMTKCTYGTGNFCLMNTGEKLASSRHGLLTTVAYSLESGRANYALEGSVFVTGAAVQWLRDGLKIIASAQETEALAMAISDTGGVFFVPGFVGMGAPYWDQYSRGMIIGITRGTTREHIVRATLEAIAYQTRDLIECMEAETGTRINSLRADGGAAVNNFLLQFQADILNKEIQRASVLETTALGAAYLAGIASAYWEDTAEVSKLSLIGRTFKPKMDSEMRTKLYNSWKEAVKRTLKWTLKANEEG